MIRMRGRIHFSKGFFPLLFSSLIIFFFAGCAEDNRILDNVRNRQLEFSVKTCDWNNSNNSSNSKKNSRATPITGTTFNTSNSFNVIADVNKGDNWSTEVKNETVSYSTSNNIWQTSAIHYWPGSGSTVNFYAYYPTSISSSITHTAGCAPVLFYTVPDNAADQIDILTSSKTGVVGDSYNQTPVDFKHVLAAVQFQVGSSGLPSGTISSITISGIKNSGTYTFGSGWALNSGTTTFKASPSTVINGTSGESITTGTYTLMMIPQTFTDATLTLIYSTGTSYTQTISGTWIAGNTYTYNLSKPVNIGDYYYSDGTWGSIAEHANSTASPIGVIFSNSTSNIDKGHNWTHGYAMALKESSSSVVWSTNVQWEMGESNAINTESLMKNDMEGYTHTKLVEGNHFNVLKNEYPAFYYAIHYSVSYPTLSSGWFLPSIGQLYYIISNLGFKSTSTTSIYWGFEFNGDASTCINNLNHYLASSGTFDITNFVSNTLLWSSSEGEGNPNTLNNAISTGVCIDNYVAFPFDHAKNENPFREANYYHVRSVIAF